MTRWVQRLEGMEQKRARDVQQNTTSPEAFMRIPFCLLIATVSLSLHGCGFLDDELLTEDSLFSAEGFGHGSGRGSIGCGGMRITGASHQGEASTAVAEEFNLQEFEMDAMTFRASKKAEKIKLRQQRLKISDDDEVVELFVHAEKQVDSAWTKAERDGVH